MQQTKAIIFDLGGVLLNIDYHLTRKSFEELGVNRFTEMYSQAAADRLFEKLEKGTIQDEDFYIEFNKCAGLNLSQDQIDNAWNAMLLDFRESSLTFLNRIKNKYRLFLLSNTNDIHCRKFREMYFARPRAEAFEKFFEKAYYSFDMRMRKPDEECYSCVLLENDLNPESTLFIDDSSQNVEAAKKLGITTIQLQPGMRIENLGL
ncbi:MAG: HAD family phosphatase [Ginsengibacter sp.]